MESRDDPNQDEHVALNCCLSQILESMKLVVYHTPPRVSLKMSPGSGSTTMVLGSALTIPPIRLESPCHLDSDSQLNESGYQACYPNFFVELDRPFSESPQTLPRRLGE